MSALFIGLMSGTSMDGIDGVLVAMPPVGGSVETLAHVHHGFAAALVEELLALNQPGGKDELHRAALAGNGLAAAYAEVVAELLSAAGMPAAQVTAIGAHGQTVRHRPGQFDGNGYTIQLLNSALLAERTGIHVIADLRSRDVAAGGQGAPLVPAFHRAVFGEAGKPLAVLNLGGIANLTLLKADGTTLGFDCGPANVLLDHWCRLHRGEPFDRDGRWAASGSVMPLLLERLLAEPYFQQSAPKSTGRDLFHPGWLQAALTSVADAAGAAPADVQATLAELTAATCMTDLRRELPAASELLVCGGGAFNGDLLRRMQARAPGVQVTTTAARGVPPDQVEAVAFAWLAWMFVERRPASLPSVTGAAGPRLLGALYPAA